MGRVALCTAVAVLLWAGTAAAAPPSAKDRKAAKAHFDQGRAYYEAGAYDDAIREYEAAFQLVPLPELQFNIGQAWRLKGDKQKAIAAYARYVDLLPDGALAEEARSQIAALKLKIQVEEAEAARKQAAEEAAAARKRADEAEAARRRLEAEAVTRAKTRAEDEARLRRVAVEEAEAARRRKEADEAALARRLEAARGEGRGLRIGGVVAIVAGVLSVTATAVPFISSRKARDQLDQWNSNNGGTWSVDLDRDIRDINDGNRAALILGVTGAALIVTGTVLYLVGSGVRSGAEERARRRVTLAPAPQRGGGGFVVAGAF
jgi:tetratricopeptide (TPR) repeat protein